MKIPQGTSKDVFTKAIAFSFLTIKFKLDCEPTLV